MQKHILFTVLVLVSVCNALAAKDSPWNLELAGSALFESNSNVFYEETGEESDMVIYVIPKVLIEYEQLNHTIFSAEIALRSLTYSNNPDASILEQDVRIKYQPVNHGMYAVAALDYKYDQNYSPASGLSETATNILQGGGGFRGHHLDYSFVVKMTQAAYSPSIFSSLDYSKTELKGNIEYLFESFYVLGDIGSGILDYADDAMHDGSIFHVGVGIGKNFYPMFNIEGKLTLMNEDHSSDGGTSFSGVLYAFSAKFVSSSGKSSIRAALEKEITPSTAGGSDFVEKMYLRVIGNTSITYRISAEASVRYEIDTMENREDNYIEFSAKGSYALNKIKPLKYISRKTKRPKKKPKKPIFRIDAGFKYQTRTSDLDTLDFSQVRIFAGATVTY